MKRAEKKIGNIIIPGFVGKLDDPLKFVVDERKALLDRLGDLSSIKIEWDRVLVAIWQAPDKKQLGGGYSILRPELSQDEDIWQGTMALVIGTGPDAYLYTDRTPIPDAPKINDFVLFRRGYGTRLKIRGVHCVMFEEPQTAIQARLERLDIIDIM